MKLMGLIGVLIIGIVLISLLISLSKQSDSYKIGVILPLSGQTAYYGEISQNGIEIAREEIARDYPEVEFDVIYEDSFFTPVGGIDAYTQLRNFHNIDAVVTGASHVSIAIQPLSNKDSLLQMAIFSAAGEYSALNDLSFRTSTRNEIEAAAVADFIKKKGYETISIIYLNTDFGVDFKDSLKTKIIEKEISIEVLNEESFLLSDNDFRTTLTKIDQNNPEVIFMVGIAAKYALILQQAKELKIDSQFISMRSAEDPVLISIAGDLANGLIYTYPFDVDYNSSISERFVTAYEAKYEKLPDAFAAEGYEGFKLTALAFIECGDDNVCLKNYLTNLKDYDSIFGKLSFDENGDVYYRFFLKKVVDGEFVRIR